MPILKDKGPVKPPKPVVEGNCFTCGKMSKGNCPFKQIMAQEMIRDTVAFREIAMADTPCGGEHHGGAPVSASMAKAVALGRVKMVGSAEKVRKYRAVEAMQTVIDSKSGLPFPEGEPVKEDTNVE